MEYLIIIGSIILGIRTLMVRTMGLSSSGLIRILCVLIRGSLIRDTELSGILGKSIYKLTMEAEIRKD